MQISKVINNNVISSYDNSGREVVVMGKGIGFQKKAGDQVCEDKIEKIFKLPESVDDHFMKLVEEIPYNLIQLSEEIIEQASERLHKKLSENLIITLTDHLNFAIERARNGLEFSNSLLWEIKKFYHDEYEIGKDAIALIKKELDVDLTCDEAGFIALHIVNAEMDGNPPKGVVAAPEVIKDVLNIIKYTYQIELDEDSISYERLVTHLKFFIQRAVKKEYYENSDGEFNNIIKNKFPESYNCAVRIKTYMENAIHTDVTDEELSYLTVHINRVVGRAQ